MKAITNTILLLAFLALLSACASSNKVVTPPETLSSATYSPAVTNDSFVFRGPPPGIVGVGVHAGGR